MHTGDIVRMKSGGPNMVMIEHHAATFAICFFIDKNQRPRKVTVAKNVLEIITDSLSSNITPHFEEGLVALLKTDNKKISIHSVSSDNIDADCCWFDETEEIHWQRIPLKALSLQ